LGRGWVDGCGGFSVCGTLNSRRRCSHKAHPQQQQQQQQEQQLKYKQKQQRTEVPLRDFQICMRQEVEIHKPKERKHAGTSRGKVGKGIETAWQLGAAISSEMK